MGHLVSSLSWPARVAVPLPVVLVLFAIADVVADTVDEHVDAAAGAGHGPAWHTPGLAAP